MFPTFSTSSLLLLTLALSSHAAIAPNDNDNAPQALEARQACPWSITLKGSADYECTSTGDGWSTSCSKGATICATGANTPGGGGGGAIKLFAPGVDRSRSGTLIECAFVNPGGNPNGDTISNCDISNVDGFNFDVHCTGDIELGWGGGGFTRDADIPNCWGAGAYYDPKTRVCVNMPGRLESSDEVREAPPFFRPMVWPGNGIYVVSRQKGVEQFFPPVQGGRRGGKITCEVNGGFNKNFKGPVNGRGKRDVGHAGSHAHRGRAHARSLGAVIAGKA